MTKKALVVTPYLDHLGGGERYMLEAASVIESAGYQLTIAWDKLTQVNKLTKLLGITLDSPQLDPTILPHYFGGNPLSMWQATRPYDLVLYLSDGSLPLLGAKKNIIHLQVPFHDVGGKSLKNQFKKRFIYKLIVNSHFTKSIVDKEYGIDSEVIYPPVNEIEPGKKEKLILSVGRFEPSLNVKQQDQLIKTFKQLSSKLPDWRLVLAGSSADQEYLTKLKELAHGATIEIKANLPYAKLIKYYQKASIYWHAAGLGIDEATQPELTEHFGITTAEAITAGAIPLVVPKGGQLEVVPNSKLHWSSLAELVNLTIKVTQNLPQYQKLASSLSVDNYSLEKFRSRIKNILK